MPPFATELDPGIVQLHSGDYRNPSNCRTGGVLIVGAGNSGAEIALDVVARPSDVAVGQGHRPRSRSASTASRRGCLMPLVFRFVFHRVLTVKTPIGRKARRKCLSARRATRARQAEGPRRGRDRARAADVGVRDGLAGARGRTASSTWRT